MFFKINYTQYTLCKVIRISVFVRSLVIVYIILLNIWIFISYFFVSMSTPLLSGWTTSLDPIITSLSDTLGEFIPYVVHIGLGVLGAVIGFVAIKWLMNWTRAKVLWTFSSGKRRR